MSEDVVAQYFGSNEVTSSERNAIEVALLSLGLQQQIRTKKGKRRDGVDWPRLAILLADKVKRPMTPEAITQLEVVGCSDVREVLAYAEGRTLRFRGGMWVRI